MNLRRRAGEPGAPGSVRRLGSHCRSTPAGAGRTVASNRRRFDRRAGAWTDLPAVFHRVVCFTALAENVAVSVRRGAAVAVTGEFADDSYTREDGGQRVRRIQN